MEKTLLLRKQACDDVMILFKESNQSKALRQDEGWQGTEEQYKVLGILYNNCTLLTVLY